MKHNTNRNICVLCCKEKRKQIRRVKVYGQIRTIRKHFVISDDYLSNSQIQTNILKCIVASLLIRKSLKEQETKRINVDKQIKCENDLTQPI